MTELYIPNLPPPPSVSPSLSRVSILFLFQSPVLLHIWESGMGTGAQPFRLSVCWEMQFPMSDDCFSLASKRAVLRRMSGNRSLVHGGMERCSQEVCLLFPALCELVLGKAPLFCSSVSLPVKWGQLSLFFQLPDCLLGGVISQHPLNALSAFQQGTLYK